MARKSSSSKSQKKPINAKRNGKGKKKTLKAGGTGLKDAKAVAEALFKYMCEEHAFGMTRWTRDDLASALGFGNSRTQKFVDGLKMLIEQQGLAQKGTKAGTAELSPKGIAKKPADIQPTTLKAIHDRYIKRLEDTVACGSNNVLPLWKILKDRKIHTIDEIASELGYKNKRSFTNTKVITLMVDMGLVTRESNNVTMTDKAFPAGAEDISK